MEPAYPRLPVGSGRTEPACLGTAIIQIPARKPAAMAAASVDVLSGGRMILGLGPSGPQVSEGWYGEPFGAGDGASVCGRLSPLHGADHRVDVGTAFS